MTRDVITEPARNAVLYNRAQRRALANRDPLPAPENQAAAKARLWAHDLVTCDWCAGFWVSTAVVAAHHITGGNRWYRLAAGAFALSEAVGLMAAVEDRLTGVD